VFLIRLFLSIIISFLTSLFLIPKFCDIAGRFNFFDEPDGKLKTQTNKVPYLGGVAIYCAFIFALSVTFPFNNDLSLYIIGSTLLLFVGLLDDFISLTPAQKFLGQIIASLCFIKAGFFLKEEFFLQPINIAISLFWFLTIINALNLVDVMDGLSSSLALYSIAAFCSFLYLDGNWPAAILLGCLFGAILGFFIYNKPPAKIYMGDAGTLFIGGIIGSAPFFISWSKFNGFGLLIPILILFIPLLELASLILIRWYKSIPFYNGSPDHFAIYLRNKGWSAISVIKLCLCINILMFIFALLFYFGVINIGALLLFCAMILLSWYKIVF
jgi:UDP-GlcNAc:undecaprenyl-phosphate/decaprenyl-phosphate GlcNAc-1-phosphate transferase